MTGSALVGAIIEILGAGVTGVATSVVGGLGALAKGIFFETVTGSSGDTTQLSVMGILIITFAAISLGLGLMRWVLNFCTSLGSRNR